MDSDSEILTLTPVDAHSFGSQKLPTPPPAWGKLIATTTFLPSVDLDKPNFLLGRGEGCDVSLTAKNFHPASLRTVSKTHFLITYEETKAIAQLTDMSKNGTFVNRKNIGNGKKVLLETNDEIAIGGIEQRVYVYQTNDKERCTYLPPEWRDKYVLTNRALGEGACGKVNLIYDRYNGEEYAVKKILKDTVDITHNLNSPERIQTEIQILKSLSHPHIISTKEISETTDAVFIVLEYMKGGDLVDRLTSSLYPLPETKIKLMFHQIVLGVQYLHSQGITHRDLKPGNILLKTEDSETVVKISDFGLSKIVHNSTVMNTICGTPTYVAPEIIENLNCTNYTKAVDIWSLGVILFQMLSKDLPFVAKDHRSLFSLILSGQYTMDKTNWKHVSANAKDLVKKMLIRNPNKRITIDDVLIHPWMKDQDMKRKERLLTTEDVYCFTAKKPRLN